jgi:hypothetical protein
VFPKSYLYNGNGHNPHRKVVHTLQAKLLSDRPVYNETEVKMPETPIPDPKELRTIEIDRHLKDDLGGPTTPVIQNTPFLKTSWLRRQKGIK